MEKPEYLFYSLFKSPVLFAGVSPKIFLIPKQWAPLGKSDKIIPCH
jgi:hypothetical protein